MTSAKRIFSEQEPGAAGKRMPNGDLERLTRKLETDPSFREQFDADPVAAAEAAGMRELAKGLERETRELVALAERIAADDGYRAQLYADPATTLASAGIPFESSEPLLNALTAPDDVVARVPEVVAHRLQQLPLDARLLTLLLESKSVVERIRVTARPRR
jgi:hypothetical protein